MVKKAFAIAGALIFVCIVAIVVAENRAALVRNKEAYEKAKVNHEERCRGNIYYPDHCKASRDGFRCDGYGELDQTLWPAREQERADKAAVIRAEMVEQNRLADIERVRHKEELARVSGFAERLKVALQHDRRFFVADSSTISSRYSISCWISDLSSFNRDFVKPSDVRIMVLGLSDLSKDGYSRLWRGVHKTVAQVLLENIDNLKNRLWKIVIVNNISSGTDNDNLCVQIKNAFNGSGAADRYVFVCDSDIEISQMTGNGSSDRSSLAAFIRRKVDPVPMLANHKTKCTKCNSQYAWDSFFGDCGCPQKNTVGCFKCLSKSISDWGRDWDGENWCPICRFADPVVVKFRNPDAHGSSWWR